MRLLAALAIATMLAGPAAAWPAWPALPLEPQPRCDALCFTVEMAKQVHDQVGRWIEDPPFIAPPEGAPPGKVPTSGGLQ